jgi:hypothetical protein
MASDRAACLNLAALVRAYLAADLEARSPPCLHRYRGIVRVREIERRWRVRREAREALDAALAAVADRSHPD